LTQTSNHFCESRQQVKQFICCLYYALVPCITALHLWPGRREHMAKALSILNAMIGQDKSSVSLSCSTCWDPAQGVPVNPGTRGIIRYLRHSHLKTPPIMLRDGPWPQQAAHSQLYSSSWKNTATVRPIHTKRREQGVLRCI
jgi:hypothetical protein